MQLFLSPPIYGILTKLIQSKFSLSLLKNIHIIKKETKKTLMKKNSTCQNLKEEPKEQYLNTVPKSCL